jgi:hypothetical protein
MGIVPLDAFVKPDPTDRLFVERDLEHRPLHRKHDETHHSLNP